MKFSVYLPYRTCLLDGRLHHDVVYWLEDHVGPYRSIFFTEGLWTYRFLRPHNQNPNGDLYQFSFVNRVDAMRFALSRNSDAVVPTTL